MLEQNFTCPYCWEDISMVLELYISETYIQDCEVCCNPIEIKTKWNGEELLLFEAKAIGQ